MVHVGPAYIPGQVERGKRIKHLDIDTSGNVVSETDLVVYTGTGYGTPLGLVFMPDGLYFSDLFGEIGFTGYAQTRGNIYRVVQGTQTTDAAPVETGLAVSLGAGRWYPQGLHMVWECRGVGGSGDYRYDYYFGDGNKQLNRTEESRYYVYPDSGSYAARCVVHDVLTGNSVETTTSVTLAE